VAAVAEVSLYLLQLSAKSVFEAAEHVRSWCQWMARCSIAEAPPHESTSLLFYNPVL